MNADTDAGEAENEKTKKEQKQEVPKYVVMNKHKGRTHWTQKTKK